MSAHQGHVPPQAQRIGNFRGQVEKVRDAVRSRWSYSEKAALHAAGATDLFFDEKDGRAEKGREGGVAAGSPDDTFSGQHNRYQQHDHSLL